jgi:hypothetical protein
MARQLLLGVKAMASGSTEAWRAVLDKLIGLGLRPPEVLIVMAGLH